MPTLLWFRRDLRLHDLPPLLDAAQADGEVLACYVLDPRLTASSGARRLQYLYDSLRELRDGLDGRLLVTRGRPETRIPALAKRIDAKVSGGTRKLDGSSDCFPVSVENRDSRRFPQRYVHAVATRSGRH